MEAKTNTQPDWKSAVKALKGAPTWAKRRRTGVRVDVFQSTGDGYGYYTHSRETRMHPFKPVSEMDALWERAYKS